MRTRAILLDIEGTTTSIEFVHKVLFPYARKALPTFVREHSEEVPIAELLQEAKKEAGLQDSSTEAVIDQLLAWIDGDQKVGALKALQGHIWKSGYENADFTGHVYDDTPIYLRAWKRAGIKLYIYSSGSVQAQKLLFGCSDAGDLCPLLSGYFDTTSGHKREAGSYQKITKVIAFPAEEILFLSDSVEELDAAAAAGMQTTQLVRDENTVAGELHRVAHDFSDINFEREIQQ